MQEYRRVVRGSRQQIVLAFLRQGQIGALDAVLKQLLSNQMPMASMSIRGIVKTR